MEDKTQLSNSDSSDRNEKTVVMGSNSKVESSMPKEQVNGPEVDNKKEKVQDAASPNNTESKSSEDFIKDSKSKSSVSPAVVVGAGAAIASGVAGVALGATFSENIKEVLGNPFESEETSPSSEEAPLVEASTTTEGNSVQEVSEEDTVQTVSETIEAEANEGNMSSLEISGIDQEGNVYSVSFLDIDGDGESDIQTAEFQTVDGLTITYTEFGNSLDSTFTNDILLADNTDYVDCGFCGVQEVSMMDSYLYEIQPGDTLSELAAANNTNVEHLMDLNPQISDADLIYAGNNLIVPNGDSFVNPESSQSNTFIAEEFEVVQEGDIYGEEPIETVDEILDDSFFVEDEFYVSEEQTELPNEELGSIDWESFYDNPVDNPYTNELEAMDFEAMETPQSYNEMDYGMEDFGMDESAIGFI
jgi:LysM repeat protein